MTLELKLGKFYLTRNGFIMGPVDYKESQSPFFIVPAENVFLDHISKPRAEFIMYTSTGIYIRPNLTGRHGMDLVKEWEPDTVSTLHEWMKTHPQNRHHHG